MSRHRRRRRILNRLSRESPATRDTRLSLSNNFVERRLRNPLSIVLDRLHNRREMQDRTLTTQPSERMRRRLLFEDRKRQSAVRRSNRLVVQDQTKIGLISNVERGNLQLDLPSRHPICVRRRERRQILFAKRKTGKGAGKQKKPRLPDIIVRCN